MFTSPSRKRSAIQIMEPEYQVRPGNHLEVLDELLVAGIRSDRDIHPVGERVSAGGGDSRAIFPDELKDLPAEADTSRRASRTSLQIGVPTSITDWCISRLMRSWSRDSPLSNSSEMWTAAPSWTGSTHLNSSSIPSVNEGLEITDAHLGAPAPPRGPPGRP